MMKQLLLAMILALSFCNPEPVINDELDEDAQVISNFLVDLIEKYDVSGKGAIPIEKYPEFLSDVFLTGNAVSKSVEVEDAQKGLLLEATTDFTKKYNGTEVGIQEFYMDLVKDFTVYLIDHEDKYENLLQIFFSDTQNDATQDNQDSFKAEQSADL